MAKKTVEQYNAEFSTLLAQLGQKHYQIRHNEHEVGKIQEMIKTQQKEVKSLTKQIDDIQARFFKDHKASQSVPESSVKEEIEEAEVVSE